MATVGRGGTIRLEVIFHEFVGGTPFDPTQPITLDIHFDNTSVLSSPLTYSPGPIIRDGVGRYHANWVVPVDADLGAYEAIWLGTINGAPSQGVEVFNVVDSGSVDPGSEPELEADVYITWAGDVRPTCLDPDELTALFPEANYLEMAIAVRNATLDIQHILKLKVDECVDDPLVLEYIKAAAACALSKIYGNGSLDGDSGLEATRIKLGDLEVEKSNGAQVTNRGRISPSNATTWCELAGALRIYLITTNTGMKAVVKGAAYCNPIPRRHFSPDSGNWPTRHGQGDLDDPPLTRNWG